MNYIIFDLEATCWQGKPPGYVSETIEIGAIRINSYGETTGEYNRFIKPILNPRLSAFCTELTSIEQEQINRAKTFPDVIEEFQDWCDIYETDYLLCSWGAFDKKMLIRDCQLHQLDADWAERHINLKKQYQSIRKMRKPIGLKRAVLKEGFEFTGIHHRGISDAENLAKVFVKFLDEWQH